MIKLFVSDMDGTLLDSNMQISSRTVKAIQSLQANGIEFMVATGRSYDSATAILDQYGIKCKIIGLNGAVMFDEKGETIWQIFLPEDVVKHVIEVVENTPNANYSLMSKRHYYLYDSVQFKEHLLKAITSTKNTPEECQERVAFVRNIKEFESYQKTPILKMMISSDERTILSALDETLRPMQEIDVTSSHSSNLEISHHQAQKGKAIQRYLAHQGWNWTQVATIGDSPNDLSMLSKTPFSFAMANSTDRIKSIAQKQAPHHDEEGVAQVMEMLQR